MKRVHVLYTGSVQGVGFRFAAESLASQLKVNGYVKNLANGQVEVMAEQEEGVLKDFLKAINNYFSRYIHNADIEWFDTKGEFKDFEIRF